MTHQFENHFIFQFTLLEVLKSLIKIAFKKKNIFSETINNYLWLF